MNVFRLQDIALYYALKAYTDPRQITLREGFLEVDFESDEPPIVTFDTDRVILTELELGEQQPFIVRVYVITVTGKTKKQRDDIVYDLLYKFYSECVPVYDYNIGFPPNPAPKVGCLVPEEVTFEAFSYQSDVVKRYHGIITLRFMYKPGG